MNALKETSCAFSGNRELPKGKALERLKTDAENAIMTLIYKGYTDFYAGGAQGFDMLCELTVLKFRTQGYDVKLHIAAPFEGQDKKWSADNKIIYSHIIKLADEVTYASQEEATEAYFIRNRAMVDASSVLICFQRKNSGGTEYTINYAQKQGLEIVMI